MAATLIVFVAVAGLVLASTQLSSIEVSASRRSVDDVRATAMAEAGVEQSKAIFEDAIRKMGIDDPLDGVRAYFNAADEADLFRAQPLVADGVAVGEYSTSVTLESDNPNEIIVRVTSTGYIPVAPENLGPGQKLSAWDSIDVTLRYALAPGNVFDYAYFLNNWGWLYGDTINLNGNARSNGQMDLGNRRATITGSPIYDSVEYSGGTATVGDRVSDGAIWSGWDIVNAARARGLGGDTDYQFDFEDPVEMPNLTDLEQYEDRAIEDGASISIGGSVVADGVVGDGAGELDNLYLHGTFANPIELNGTVVVRGDVIISGYVSGQGSIYTGGNVYVPDSIHYLNGPTSERPTDNSDAAVEAWISQNWNADFLGLFAREHVVVGDYTSRSWEYYVNNWLNSSMNSSHEDSGTDQVPNTRPGRDGIWGTADDDWLEGDGQFSTDYYTAADAALGLIPDGKAVGDRIPGSGEDIDGDGVYDDTVTIDDFKITDSLNTANWEGNMPASGISRYRDIASLYANHLDATFYTNHAFSWVVFGGSDAVLNGSMVARNENIVYGTPEMTINHDARLLGGAGGMAGDLLPLTAQPVEVVQWRRNDVDPHRVIVTP